VRRSLDWPLFWHRVEWVLNHPRFGLVMIGLVLLSFVHRPLIALALFCVFFVEMICRVVIVARKRRTNPYRDSEARRIELVMLLLDGIATLSLLVSVLELPIAAEGGTGARVFRALYLLRTLRLFRYIDLQSAMYSPTYGMLISLVVLLSFFATSTLLWGVILFFSAELVVRAALLRSMRFASPRDRISEWLFWWIDLVATLAMVPSLAFIPYGGALRMFRLVRLLRPWLVILRNLRIVIQEGQYLQEINLVVLLLAVLSIGAGVIGRVFMPDYDYTQDGRIDAADRALLAPIWFSFRLFSDPGNIVRFPERPEIAVFSILALITGLFILAFFIGVGASIVAGLMQRLRNERLNITGHMLLLGWNKSAPFVVEALRLLDERFHSALKLVRLVPDQIESKSAHEGWLMTRRGNVHDPAALAKVNLAEARQAIVFVPEGSVQEQFAYGLTALMAIRRQKPDLYLSYAMEHEASPRLRSHRHPLQIGWDTKGFYDQPTVVFSRLDVRANLLRNVIVYRDFDQVMHRLLAPERNDESALQICEYEAEVVVRQKQAFVRVASNEQPLAQFAGTMFQRGAALVALVDEAGRAHPLYRCKRHSFRVCALLGLALSPAALWAEARWAMEHPAPLSEPIALAHTPLVRERRLRLLVIGWPGALPLIVKRLLDRFASVEITILDALATDQIESQQRYLLRRIEELPQAVGRVSVRYLFWDFHEIEALRPHLRWADRVLMAPPLQRRQATHEVIAVLAQMSTILREEGLERLEVFPIVENRTQALALQEELDRFDSGLEIHVVVPEEFFGTFVAHTSFQMYLAESPRAYELQRTLRHALDDLMGDVGEEDAMDLGALRVQSPLPADAGAVFQALLAEGMIWIGYRLRRPYLWHDPWQRRLERLFPPSQDFRCLRQREIVLNPFVHPLLRRSWTQKRHEIAELIVIAEDFSALRQSMPPKEARTSN